MADVDGSLQGANMTSAGPPTLTGAYASLINNNQPVPELTNQRSYSTNSIDKLQ